MRSKLIVANWKMNLDFWAGLQLANAILQQLQAQAPPVAQVILLPSYLHLQAIKSLLPTSDLIQLGAQNCHEQAGGAFTGEISASMLHSVGARFVLIGHSERREHWGENEVLLAHKVTTALAHGLRPIFCCGEYGATREAGQAIPFVQQQLAESLFHLTATEMAQVILAYEPVWAIGTGRTPTPDEVQAMHQAIRSTVAQQYSATLAQQIPILYGGSCNAQNASSFFACSEVDGGLIGSASLQAASLVAIIRQLL